MAELKSIPVDQKSTLTKALDNFARKTSSELYLLQNIIHLAAFACEARRTLEAYQSNANLFPKFQEHFSTTIEASSNWDCFKDVSAEVLRDVANRLGALSEEIYEDTAAIG